jgi:hypothetical protein
MGLFTVLLSRKFWMTMMSLAVTVGLLDLSDPAQAEMAATIAGGLGAVYTLAVAIEDGLRGR